MPVLVHFPMGENGVAVGAFLHAILPFEFGRVLLPCRLHQLDLLLMNLVLLPEHGHGEEARIVAFLFRHDHREEDLVEARIGSVRLAVDGQSYELCANLAVPSFLPRNSAGFEQLDDLLRRFHIDVAFWVLHSAFLPFIAPWRLLRSLPCTFARLPCVRLSSLPCRPFLRVFQTSCVRRALLRLARSR